MTAREAPIHRMEGLADYMRQRLHGALRLVGEAQRAGVIIPLGTDSSAGTFRCPGFSAHVEMELLAEAGLSPIEVVDRQGLLR
jgi:imidazolonepropionase-like amidohydrolase